jgi:hypothetical protein
MIRHHFGTKRLHRHCERKRSNPEPRENWIASSLSLLAVTTIMKTGAPRNNAKACA